MKSKYRVLVADPISPKGVELLQQSLDVVVKTGQKEDEVAAMIKDFDAVVVRSQTKITPKIIQAGVNLKAIGRAGVGVDNIDVEAATQRGIIVMNTPGGNTISTAELAFSLMVSLARKIPQAHATMVAGKWDRKSFEGVELCNKVLGIIGMGRIGAEFARRAIGFGMRVVAFDPYLTLARAKSMQVELCDQLEPLLKESDFITVHTPMTPETKGILNAKTMGMCKKGVRLINCARGGLIVEKDLIEMLKSGHVAGAALDVFEQEPPSPDNELLKLPNVVLTPHLGASTAEAQESVGIEVAELIRDVLTSGAVSNAVNMPNLDAHTAAKLRPYLNLAEKLGSMIAQLSPKRLDQLNINYSGTVSEYDTTSITRAILKGVLRYAGGNDVNDVNAPIYAKNLGLTFKETKVSEPGDYTELIKVEVVSGDEKHTVSATFYGPRPRIVEIDGYLLEAIPEGNLFIMQNVDRPGIVGWIGTLLGNHKVNIANMSLSRAEPGSAALSVLNLDTAPSEATLKEILADKDIRWVKVVSL
ncbi:MAG: phosphoglycerate dehydrogenase [Verrucomicrobiota bacterium]